MAMINPNTYASFAGCVHVFFGKNERKMVIENHKCFEGNPSGENESLYVERPQFNIKTMFEITTFSFSIPLHKEKTKQVNKTIKTHSCVCVCYNLLVF